MDLLAIAESIRSHPKSEHSSWSATIRYTIAEGLTTLDRMLIVDMLLHSLLQGAKHLSKTGHCI